MKSDRLMIVSIPVTLSGSAKALGELDDQSDNELMEEIARALNEWEGFSDIRNRRIDIKFGDPEIESSENV